MQPTKKKKQKQQKTKAKQKLYRTHCSKTSETQLNISINKNREAMQKH